MLGCGQPLTTPGTHGWTGSTHTVVIIISVSNWLWFILLDLCIAGVAACSCWQEGGAGHAQYRTMWRVLEHW